MNNVYTKSSLDILPKIIFFVKIQNSRQTEKETFPELYLYTLFFFILCLEYAPAILQCDLNHPVYFGSVDSLKTRIKGKLNNLSFLQT